MSQMCDYMGLGCALLQNVAFPRRCITSVGRFAFRCTAVVHIDLTACENLREIGFAFGTFCAALKSVSLPRSVEVIGSFFLAEAGVENIDLSRLDEIREVGAFFTHNCNNLLRVALPTKNPAQASFCLRRSMVCTCRSGSGIVTCRLESLERVARHTASRFFPLRTCL